MSRIGKLPISIPSGVEVKIENQQISVKGPLGSLQLPFDRSMEVVVEDNQIIVKKRGDSRQQRAYHGLYRALINNMVEGVTKGYEKKLQIEGTGYRAAKNGKDLNLTLGLSHPVVMTDPEGITVEVPSQTEIVVKGVDKQQVGNYAAKIRAWRKPEPYLGKGIRYVGEYVRRKEGKSGK
ncbi:50S ribosomal protein L6 [Guggenheimella bovis]